MVIVTSHLCVLLPPGNFNHSSEERYLKAIWIPPLTLFSFFNNLICFNHYFVYISVLIVISFQYFRTLSKNPSWVLCSKITKRAFWEILPICSRPTLLILQSLADGSWNIYQEIENNNNNWYIHTFPHVQIIDWKPFPPWGQPDSRAACPENLCLEVLKIWPDMSWEICLALEKLMPERSSCLCYPMTQLSCVYFTVWVGIKKIKEISTDI